MITKYNFEVKKKFVLADVNRLTNQLWKLIPMKENDEDWKSQLDTVLIELVGFNEILNVDEKFLILLTKLEGLKCQEDVEFSIYRKTIFESISLLREIRYE